MTKLYELTLAELNEQISYIVKYGFDLPKLDALLHERTRRFGKPD